MKPRLHWHTSLQIPSLVVDYPSLVLSDLRVSLAFLGCIPWWREARGRERERENFKRVDFIHIRLQPRARSLEKVLLGYSSAY